MSSCLKKRELCEINNVILIEIPYTVEYDQMQNYIINECKKKNVIIPKIGKKIDFREFDMYSYKNKELQKSMKLEKFIK